MLLAPSAHIDQNVQNLLSDNEKKQQIFANAQRTLDQLTSKLL